MSNYLCSSVGWQLVIFSATFGTWFELKLLVWFLGDQQCDADERETEVYLTQCTVYLDIDSSSLCYRLYILSSSSRHRFSVYSSGVPRRTSRINMVTCLARKTPFLSRPQHLGQLLNVVHELLMIVRIECRPYDGRLPNLVTPSWTREFWPGLLCQKVDPPIDLSLCPAVLRFELDNS